MVANSAAASSDFGSVTQTQANVSGAWFGSPALLSNGLASYTDAMGSPTKSVQSQLVNATSTPNTVAALNKSLASIFGAGVMGANDASITGTRQYTESTEHVFNLSGSHTFTLGLLNLASYGSGFSSLTFTVKDGATTLLSDKFTSLSAAQKFFTDDPLSLGTFKGSVDLTMSLQVTANKIEGTGISYVLADAAAPAAAAQPAAIVIGRSGVDAGYRQ